MTQHVFARLAGFGLAVIPRAPFRIHRAAEPAQAIDIEYQSPDGRLFARLIPDHGGYKSKTAQGTASLYDVVDVESGPNGDDWRIETSEFTCHWPLGYTLCSNNFPQDPGPFDLIGSNREMIYTQQPAKMPDIAEMCGPGQTIIDMQRGTDSAWVELEYHHQGRCWRQRHEVVTLLGFPIAVTVQAPLEFANDARAAAQQVARSLAPYAL